MGVSLPPVRKKVFRHSLRIVGLYVVVGVFMMLAVFSASDIAPQAVHLNYDSIAAASKMSHAWNALRNPQQHPELTPEAWNREFENGIAFEEKNISEPGEAQIAVSIRLLWDKRKKASGRLEQTDFSLMESHLDRLTNINEKGMFAWATKSYLLRQRVLVATVLLFVVTIIVALLLADGLAVVIASPLRELAAVLKREPEPGTKLKLPQPNTLEMRILSQELLHLWERVSELTKLNLEELSAQGKHLETVLSSVDDAILVLDNQETVVHCNEGMLGLLGLKLTEIIGQKWKDLSSMSQNYLSLREVLHPDVSSDRSLELQLTGGSRIFSGRCREILNEQDIQIGSLYLLHDITEIRQKDRLKNEFIGVLSHELKTPLQSLGTAAELLLQKRSLLDEEGKMLVETVNEDVGRIRGVANEFVQVGLVDLHSLRLRMEPVAIQSLMQQWIQPFQVLAKDRAVKIEFIHEGSSTIMARIDIVKFPWAITNLLSNAIRVAPPDSVVAVSVSDREKFVDIEVRDEGPGIPPLVQRRMFDPFFQGAQMGVRTSGFLGLGLTITKEVVEAHDGQIEYFSREPSGSTFRIRLPLLMS